MKQVSEKLTQLEENTNIKQSLGKLYNLPKTKTLSKVKNRIRNACDGTKNTKRKTNKLKIAKYEKV